jgi:hypothetical protein
MQARPFKIGCKSKGGRANIHFEIVQNIKKSCRVVNRYGDHKMFHV